VAGPDTEFKCARIGLRSRICSAGPGARNRRLHVRHPGAIDTIPIRREEITVEAIEQVGQCRVIRYLHFRLGIHRAGGHATSNIFLLVEARLNVQRYMFRVPDPMLPGARVGEFVSGCPTCAAFPWDACDVPYEPPVARMTYC
jgi:hypothetical protein